MGCITADAPAPVNYGQQTRDTLQAQIDLAPQQYAAEAQYQPKYAELQLAAMNKLLNGTPGGTSTSNTPTTAGQTGWFDAKGNFISPGTLQTPTPAATTGDLRGKPATTANPYYTPGTAPATGAVWRNSGERFDVPTDTTVAPQAGLFKLLQEQNSNQRQSDITDVANMGGAATDALLNSNPYQKTLLTKLNAQANSGLDAGSNLTPDEQRAMQQDSRAAFAARGMGGSNGSVADELLKQFNLGQQLQTQRQQFAQSVLAQNQSVVGDPFQQILGRSSGAVAMTPSVQQSSGPSLFNPESATSSAITAGNQQVASLFNSTPTAQAIKNDMPSY